MTIDNELIDNLLKDYKKPEDIIGENGLLKQLTKQLLERAMAAELTDHIGYEKHETAGHKSGNSRSDNSCIIHYRIRSDCDVWSSGRSERGRSLRLRLGA